MKLTKEVNEYGDIFYYNENGELHREDGPAVEYSSGSKHWCLNGKIHNEDGPAIISFDGSKEYWLNNKEYSEQKFNDFLLRKRLQKIMEL
jgi:hypothetical protein